MSVVYYMNMYICTFLILQLSLLRLCVSIGQLGVWGELVNHKRFLIHNPCSKGWAPRFLFILCLCVCIVGCGVLGLGFLSSLLLQLTILVCYTRVFSCIQRAKTIVVYNTKLCVRNCPNEYTQCQ